MSKAVSSPTRVAGDIAVAAAAVAPGENRTVTEQINRWARLGMQVERSTTATNRRVLAAITGEGQFADLTADERVVAHAAIDADITDRVARVRFGDLARRAGQTTVSVDDDGRVVRIAPDGTRTVL
jgi:hypothetical protein